jgi:protein arginine kinase activator
VNPTLCQSCSQNPATIHFTEILQDERRELHVCEACANAQGLTGGTALPPLLSNLVEGVRKSGLAVQPKCPECGITFEDFRTRGRFGCPRDYDVFKDSLGPLLDKIHGKRQHTGRLPRGRANADGGTGDRLLRLRRELQEAVGSEKYEEAARLRDEIRRAERPAEEPSAAREGGEGGRGAR